MTSYYEIWKNISFCSPFFTQRRRRRNKQRSRTWQEGVAALSRWKQYTDQNGVKSREMEKKIFLTIRRKSGEGREKNETPRKIRRVGSKGLHCVYPDWSNIYCKSEEWKSTVRFKETFWSWLRQIFIWTQYWLIQKLLKTIFLFQFYY